jgi:hypothetical protein
MLFQVLLDIIVFLLKYVLRVVVALGAIPFGVFVLLHKLFPAFSHNLDFWFWSVFSILSLIGVVLLWRPIMWIMGGLSILGAGSE